MRSLRRWRRRRGGWLCSVTSVEEELEEVAWGRLAITLIHGGVKN